MSHKLPPVPPFAPFLIAFAGAFVVALVIIGVTR